MFHTTQYSLDMAAAYPQVVHAKNFLWSISQANDLNITAGWTALRHKEFSRLVESMVNLRMKKIHKVLILSKVKKIKTLMTSIHDSHLSIVLSMPSNCPLLTQSTASIFKAFKGSENSCSYVVIIHLSGAIVVQALNQENNASLNGNWSQHRLFLNNETKLYWHT